MDSPTETRPYSCTLCGKTYIHQASVYGHMKIHNGIKKYQCIFCGVSFAQPGCLRNHINTHTLEKPYQCRHCSMSFGRKGGLNGHILTMHSKIKRTLTCNLCDKKYMSRSGLVCHLRLHTGEMPYKCLDCHQRFRRPDFLRKHMENGKCKRESARRETTRSRKKVTGNEAKNHPENIQGPNGIPPKDIADTSGHLKYECGRCQEDFHSSNELVLHLSHHKTTTPDHLSEVSWETISFPARPTYLMWEKKMPILLPVNIFSAYDEAMNGQACIVTPPYPRLTPAYEFL